MAPARYSELLLRPGDTPSGIAVADQVRPTSYRALDCSADFALSPGDSLRTGRIHKISPFNRMFCVSSKGLVKTENGIVP